MNWLMVNVFYVGMVVVLVVGVVGCNCDVSVDVGVVGDVVVNGLKYVKVVSVDLVCEIVNMFK